jgi:hypothetical protein
MRLQTGIASREREMSGALPKCYEKQKSPLATPDVAHRPKATQRA